MNEELCLTPYFVFQFLSSALSDMNFTNVHGFNLS